MLSADMLREKFGYPFSHQTVRAAELAEGQARDLQHKFIGAEHLVLGVLAVNDPTIAALGINSIKIRKQVDFWLRKHDGEIPEPIGFDLQAQNAIRSGVTKAKELKHPSLCPPHMMLGILQQKYCIAVEILASQGYSIEDLRTKIIEGMASRVADFSEAQVATPPAEAKVTGWLSIEERRQQDFRQAVDTFLSLRRLRQQPELPRTVTFTEQPYVQGKVYNLELGYHIAADELMTAPVSVRRMLRDLDALGRAIDASIALYVLGNDEPNAWSVVSWRLKPQNPGPSTFGINLASNPDFGVRVVGLQGTNDPDRHRMLSQHYNFGWKPGNHPDFMETFADGAKWTQQLLSPK